MRTLQTFSLLVIIFLSSISCDEIDELTEIELSESVSESQFFEFQSDSDMPIEISIEELFDITSIPEVGNNREFIQSVDITSIEYSFSNFSGNPDAIITEAVFTSADVIIPLEDIQLKPSADNNSVYQITDPSKLSELSNLLDTNATTITTSFKGILDGTPVAFDLDVSIHLFVVIDVL